MRRGKLVSLAWRCALLLLVATWLEGPSRAECAEHDRVAPPPVEFTRDVIPALTKAGCNAGACHGSFQGRGGFRLSLLGFDPSADFESLTRAARGRRISPAAPAQSLLLAKPSGLVPHQGGVRLERGSPPFEIIRRWIAEGLRPPHPGELAGVRLSVIPSTLRLAPGQSASLRVVAQWKDGHERDVTAWALYDSRETEIASIRSDGHVQASLRGRTAITVRYLGQVASVPTTVPFAGQAVEPQEFAIGNVVDEFVVREWKALGLAPGPRANDSEFLRRVSLDLIGTLPTPAEAEQFFADLSPDKRARLVDSLLQRPEYVDYWSLRWGDLLRAHRRYLGEKGLATYTGWIRQQVRVNRPLDQLARELLTAQGNLYTSGPVGFYFIDERVEDLAESAAQVFLGVRLQCTRCHHHPQEVWGQEDYYGLAAFFTRLETKDSGSIGSRFGGPKSLRWISRPNPQRQPQFAAELRLFGTEIDAAKVDSNLDVRQYLADWLTRPENPFFARNLVNRYWAALFGRGLVEPVDDLRATNPPAMPELYGALTREFVTHGYDAKHLLKVIAKSETYQRAINLQPEQDEDGRFLTHRVPRRLPAEVLLDAINQATESSERFDGVPPGTRAIVLPDPTIISSFLTTFGRPQRNSPCDCARTSAADLSQTLHLINSPAIHQKVVHDQGRLARLVKEGRSDEEIARELYLACLSRPPSLEELDELRQIVVASPVRIEAWQDIFWALLNSAEFSYR